MNSNHGIKFLYQDLTGKVIHCCMAVHKELGCGFMEKVYQEALAIVLTEQGIVTPFNDIHSLNANAPIKVTELGISILINEMQERKAYPEIIFKLFPKVILDNAAQL